MTGTARAWTVAVTGASGLVGSALVTGLTSAGHRVVRVVRGAGAASVAGQRPPRRGPETRAPEPPALAGAGAGVPPAGGGMVLSRRGGALGAMLTPFRLGAGGPVGSGVQWVSWIAIDDLVGAILHALATESLAGPVNAVAPEPVTNRELARTLGRVLRRPALLPLPAVAARLLFGQMADELLLASARVEPARLRATGFTFRHARLEDAFRHELGRPHRTRPT